MGFGVPKNERPSKAEAGREVDDADVLFGVPVWGAR